MGNVIVEKYFNFYNLAKDIKKILKHVKDKAGFIVKKEIFRGQIYDRNKVGSIIYRGRWRNLPVVLKIQGLKLEIDEIDIFRKFNQQNKSKIIRLPKLLAGRKWAKKDGYGYLIMEFIDAPQIYQAPFASRREIKNFLDFYKEYKTKTVNKPFFTKDITEQNSLIFTVQRISHWLKIAETKNSLNSQKIKLTERFLSLAGKHLPVVKMEFMHGHLTSYDIYRYSNNEYVLMSNLFWSYRPEYYDAVFHLWAAIKSIGDKKINSRHVIKYLLTWVKAYKTLPLIRKDRDFERKFNIMMLERCLGAILLDIDNQYYSKDKKPHCRHLMKIFIDIFNYYFKKL